MKFFLNLCLLLALHSFAFGQDRFPIFKECEGLSDIAALKQCYEKKLDEFKSSVFQKVVKKQSLYIEDYVTVRFSFDEKKNFSLVGVMGNSAFLRNICTEETEKIAPNLVPGSPSIVYEISFEFKIPRELRFKNRNSQIANPPYLSQAYEFNEKGKRASFLYLFQLAEQGILQMDFKGEINCDYFFKDGKIVGIDYNIPFNNPELNDQLYEVVLDAYKDQISKRSVKQGQDFKYNFRFNTYKDSTDRFNGNRYYISTLDPIRDKYFIMNKIVGFAKDVYAKDPIKQSVFIREFMKIKGLDSVKSYYDQDRHISMDSLYTYLTSERVQEVDETQIPPVFAGCDPDQNLEKLSLCTHNALQRYIAKKFEFPEMALQMGIQGMVTTSFIIDKNGSITQIEILEGVDPILDLSVIRLFSEIPDFERPAMANDQPKESHYVFPLNLQLQ
ncbi:MAG TPA: hypothetical protein DCG19_02390 [Cryomorphaceae bacterium]|nr:hypothetical protein [Owenweeksia sp.]MBF98416.1 hypothetical protein [Owenweeksia sp.]HAD96222.1 hypothetical protein [Cryomorphaceae bacterium]HBF21216.1 hypothetical protein [Cryomorphaceae bacterium]